MSLFSDSLRAFLRPVLPYLDDPTVSEILINAPAEVWFERKGRLQRAEATFTEDGLLAAARNMAQFVGRPLTDEQPRLDARLPDGSRIHVILPPIARRGACISIRKFHQGGLTIANLIESGSLTPELARFLQACVVTKRNMVVAGGTGSGKTTLLNILSTLIPDEDRIVTIEDSAELQIRKPHLVSLESRPADRNGRGTVTLRDLLMSCLRLRPDRIIVGEVRGGEAFELLQAMNTGHGGTLCTTHANTPLETLARLESLCLLSGVELPLRAVRSQVATALHIVIVAARLADGTRRVTHVGEVLPLDQRGDYRVQDLFVYTQTGRDEERVHGYMSPTGCLPTFRERLVAEGFSDITPEFFDPRMYGYPPPPFFTAPDEPPPRPRFAREDTNPGVDPDL
ncbi:MAG TPA: CpaF family protein [Polyangia bacterium]